MMGPLLSALMLATVAGLSIPFGAWLGSVQRLVPGWMEEEFRHSVVAIGGGALFSAIALVLVPEGAELVPPVAAVAILGAGGLCFYAIERFLSSRGGHAAQFLAMMLDYLPEAAALGALVTGRRSEAVMMAGIIMLQNLPEAFNAYRELDEGHRVSRRRQLTFFALMVPLGPLAAWIGMALLSERDLLLGGMMLFSAGGLLYLIFQDIAPNVRLERHWGPPLGAVGGFLLGFAGHLATGG